MDCLKNKIIQLNEEKKQPLTLKKEEESKKSFLPLDVKCAKTTKRVLNENDNTIRKIKLIH